MDKKDAMQQVLFVRSNHPEIQTQFVFDSIIEYINKQDDFSYSKLHRFIDSLMPTKMGGIYIEIGRSLRHLKQRLKMTKKINA